MIHIRAYLSMELLLLFSLGWICLQWMSVSGMLAELASSVLQLRLA